MSRFRKVASRLWYATLVFVTVVLAVLFWEMACLAVLGRTAWLFGAGRWFEQLPVVSATTGWMRPLWFVPAGVLWFFGVWPATGVYCYGEGSTTGKLLKSVFWPVAHPVSLARAVGRLAKKGFCLIFRPSGEPIDASR